MKCSRIGSRFDLAICRRRSGMLLLGMVAVCCLAPRGLGEWNRGQGASEAASLRFADQPAERRFADIRRMVERSSALRLIGAEQWQSLVEAHRPSIEAAITHGDFSRAVNALLSAAGISHFHYYTDEDWTYWHLLSTFGPQNASKRIEHVGLVPERIDGRWFVRGILEGSPAAAANVRVGDELLAVDDRPFEPVASFRGRANRPVTLTLRRRPELVVNIRITPVRESLYRAVQRAVGKSLRVIEHEGHKLAYLHGWTLLGTGVEYQRMLEWQDEVDGLILDYRDGFGGTWHAAIRFLLGDRDDAEAATHWHKPVVILTGTGTRSAKEIVVDAVRREGRAPLIGTPTPGEVTSVGGVRPVGADGMLMLPGIRFSLEGKPTQPDVLIERDIRYCAGRDPQMDLARTILLDLIHESRKVPSTALPATSAEPTY